MILVVSLCTFLFEIRHLTDAFGNAILGEGVIDRLGLAQFHNLDAQNEFSIKGNIWPALFSYYTFLYVDGYMKIYNSTHK